jgi:hypothetical protein
MRSQCISRLRATSWRPTTGTLFSAWQATTQALQPVQIDRSIDIPHCGPPAGAGAISDGRSPFRCAVNAGFARSSASVVASAIGRRSPSDQWSCVRASVWWPKTFVISTPCSHHAPSGRSGQAFAPTPLATASPPRRP